MNTRNKVAIAALASTAVVVTGFGIGSASAASATTDTLSVQQLVALYEEERLAGDVYDAFGAVYDDQIFDKISVSEDHHQAAVATLLEGRGYDITSLPTAPGDYATDGYDDMYDDFVSTGSSSLEDAYGVGVTIEEADIVDLENLLAQTDDDAEIQVLTDLLDGSTHHLAAFSGDVTLGGGMQYGKDVSTGQQGPRQGMQGQGMQGQGQRGQGQSGDCPADGHQPQMSQGQRGQGMQSQGMQRGRA